MPVSGDGLYEAHESFIVTIASASATVTVAEAAGRILNDDPKPLAAAPAYGQDSGFLFDPVFYLWRYPELIPAFNIESAISEYRQTGAAQHKSPNAWFDAGFYGRKYGDLAQFVNYESLLFTHFNPLLSMGRSSSQRRVRPFWWCPLSR